MTLELLVDERKQVYLGNTNTAIDEQMSKCYFLNNPPVHDCSRCHMIQMECPPSKLVHANVHRHWCPVRLQNCSRMMTKLVLALELELVLIH